MNGYGSQLRLRAVAFTDWRPAGSSVLLSVPPARLLEFSSMHEGIIIAVKIDRGFGFIGERGGPDVYFHISDVVDLEWNEQLHGRRVLFDLVSTPKGFQAKYVRPAD
jgi:cold shock CspA family protein